MCLLQAVAAAKDKGPHPPLTADGITAAPIIRHLPEHLSATSRQRETNPVSSTQEQTAAPKNHWVE